MTVRVYRSTDVSAPVLDSSSGSLVAVLDACLVSGYGSKVGSGWTIAYTGSNKRSYRFPSGNQRYLRIDDTNGANPIARGYESMSDIDTGTGQFPTALQETLYWFKASNSGPLPWVVVATQTMVHIWINAYRENPAGISYCTMYSFGDIISDVVNDQYSTYINGCYSQNSINYSTMVYLTSTLTGTQSGQYMCRNYLGTDGAIQTARFVEWVQNGSNGYIGNYSYQARASFPDAMTQTIIPTQLWITEPSISSVRGVIPGVWSLNQNAWSHLAPASSSNAGQIAFNTGEMAGKVLEVFPLYQSLFLLEVSDTW